MEGLQSPLGKKGRGEDGRSWETQKRVGLWKHVSCYVKTSTKDLKKRIHSVQRCTGRFSRTQGHIVPKGNNKVGIPMEVRHQSVLQGGTLCRGKSVHCCN